MWVYVCGAVLCGSTAWEHSPLGCKEGAELVVFPETWIPTYPYWTMGWDTIANGFHDIMADLQDNSVVVGSEDTDALGKAAKEAGAYVVMGCNELDDRIGSRTL